MKRFLILALAFLAASSAWASRCGGGEVAINYYLFSPFEKPEDRPVGLYCDFWSAYAGAQVSRGDVSGLAWAIGSEDSYNPIVKAARDRNDTEMLQYLDDLALYLRNNADHYNEWRYPTKEDMAKVSENYAALLARAREYKGAKLKDRYNLMAMRCLFQLERFQEVEELWKSDGEKAADSDCRSTMMGLYAGALYAAKRTDEAAKIFMALGDRQSLKYCLDGKRNVAGIKEVCAQDCNSPLLMFLVADFVNMYQENIDGDQLISDYYTIPQGQALEFISLAEQVIASGKSSSPLLWGEAAALLSSYLGNDGQAGSWIEKCAKLDGTQRLKDNLRIIRLYQFVKTSGPNANPEYMTSEMKWLNAKARECEFHSCACSRICDLVRDRLKGDFNMEFLFSPSYRGLFEASLEQVLELRRFLKNPKKMNQFQKYLLSVMAVKPDDGDFDDVLGTKYMGRMDFEKAAEYLSKVKPDHYSDFCIGNLMINRSYSAPAWDSQPNPVDDCPPSQLVTRNSKLDFCQDIISIENQYGSASGNSKCELAYQLAAMYQSATHWGGCWFMTHYYWSVYDEEDPVYLSYEKKALRYLAEAVQSSDGNLKSKALYAQAWITWHNYEYFAQWASGAQISPGMKESMDALCQYWDSVHGYGEWTMPCDFVMDYMRAR